MSYKLIPFAFLPLTAAYAEIHYRFRFLRPAYYKKEPEIIADLPRFFDLSKDKDLPILILIKDADLYPISLKKIVVNLSGENFSHSQHFPLEVDIDKAWFSQILYLKKDIFSPDSEMKVGVKIIFRQNGKEKTVNGDNLRGISSQYFTLHILSERVKKPSGWFCGDLHYHSNYTSDQVEFGAPVADTALIAAAQGMDWFCVTDHSYDLDDMEDDYLKPDAKLHKWHNMRKECSRYDSPRCRIIAGEEISIGNHRGENVHLLALQHDDFIPGSGDSAEIWFKNKPEHSLREIKGLKNDKNLFIAAHPLEKVPWLQKVTLRRGNWQLLDFEKSAINILQLINSDEPKKIARDLKTWTSWLLQGKKFFICAGNDAHGNFNVMRQIQIPFLKLWQTKKQTFGNWLTIIQSDSNEPLPALKLGKMIVSNGPFITFSLSELANHWQLGETCPLSHATVKYQTGTNDFYGEIETVYCYRGDCDTGKEFRFPVACPVNIALPPNGYIRMSLITSKGFLAFTNPIFTCHQV